MAKEDGIQRGGDREGDIDPPLSGAEELIQAHPDIRVMRSEYDFGEVEITQRVGHRWRYILIDVEHEEGSQQHYPEVIISAYETPRNTSPYEDISKHIRSYSLTTLVRVHVDDDEQVTIEVGYQARQRYPSDFSMQYIHLLEKYYAHPIPAQEIVATAQTGLEMLKAYREALLDQQLRIYDDNFIGKWDNSTWAVQFYDGEPGRDMDTRIAEASPLLANVMKLSGISYMVGPH